MQTVGKQLSTGLKRFNTTDNCKNEVDSLFEELGDLVNTQFRAWYCQRFYRLGRTEVLKRASIARNDGFNKAKLFSKLIKS